MTTDPYRWPDSTDILGQLRDAEARIARVQALMDTHATKDGRVPICQLRTALGGAASTQSIGSERCVHEDADQERPLLTLPAHTGPAFGRGIPAKRWCWTHVRWEHLTPPGQAPSGGAE